MIEHVCDYVVQFANRKPPYKQGTSCVTIKGYNKRHTQVWIVYLVDSKNKY